MTESSILLEVVKLSLILVFHLNILTMGNPESDSSTNKENGVVQSNEPRENLVSS